MALISAADIVTQFRKRFGTRGESELDLSGSILPVANIADLDTPPWNAKKGHTGVQRTVAVAAQFPYAMVTYPPTTQGNALVTRDISLCANANCIVRLGVFSYAYATSVIAGWAGSSWGTSWDTVEEGQYYEAAPTEYGGLIRSGAQMLGVTSATDLFAAHNGGFDVNVPAGSGNRVYVPFCIRSGFALVARGDTVNVTLNMSVYADEYVRE